MNLKEELGAFAQQMSENAPQEVLETMGAEIGKLAESGIAENALKAGQKAPDFELQDSEGNLVSLDKLLKNGPVVISFNRGNWCPFCNIEFKHLQEKLKEINANGATLVSISPQLPEKSAALKAEYGYDYSILYDKNNAVAKSFGVSFTLAEPLRPIHEAFEMDIPGHNGNNSFELPLAATYVIDKNREIIYSFISANWMERAEPSEFISKLSKTVAS